ncbi:hypothetical protein R3I94_020167 [Phoxinus phoxinus]
MQVFTSDTTVSDPDPVGIAQRTDEAKPAVLSAWASERDTTASPEGTFSPTEKPAKASARRAVRALCRRLGAVVKQPFLCCDPDSVQHITPPQLSSVPGPSRIRPTADGADHQLVCLPGQVCEDLPLPMCVPGSTGIEPTVPDYSCSDLPNETAAKGRKSKAVRPGFFIRAREAVKLLFHDSAQPDPDQPEPVCVSDQACPDLESSPVIESSSEIKQAADGSDQAGSVSPPFSVPETPDEESADPEIELTQGSVVSLFEVGSLMTSGKFSKVYEGNHVFSDIIKVAIKCIPKRRTARYLDVPDHSRPVLEEVALMLRLGQAPSCPNIIKLHQWVEEESGFVLIMEKPECRSLQDFILMADDMTERQACWLMLQAVQAVKHCHERGVFHGDIHTGNFLVSHHSLELKLIDFRCARLINTQGFNSSEYQGRSSYTPPEVIGHNIFHAGPANVWALGLLLFEIMHGYLPFESFDAILRKCIDMDPAISTACHDLIFQCLTRNPDRRLTLGKLEENQWMKILDRKKEGAPVPQ